MKHLKISTSWIALVLLVAVVLGGCKKKEEEEGDGTLNVRIVSTFNGEAFATGNAYMNSQGYNIRVDIFKFYLANLAAIREDGSREALRSIDLIKMDSGFESHAFRIPEGNYKGIEFGIGVPVEVNANIDPTIYPNDHPLSVNGADGMFWTWNTGYIFTMVEGKADLEGGDDLLSPFAFHSGADQLYRTHVVNNASFCLEKDGSETITIHFEVDKFFVSESDTVDIAVDNLTHTGGNFELAERFTNQINGAIRVE